MAPSASRVTRWPEICEYGTECCNHSHSAWSRAVAPAACATRHAVRRPRLAAAPAVLHGPSRQGPPDRRPGDAVGEGTSGSGRRRLSPVTGSRCRLEDLGHTVIHVDLYGLASATELVVRLEAAWQHTLGLLRRKPVGTGAGSRWLRVGRHRSMTRQPRTTTRWARRRPPPGNRWLHETDDDVSATVWSVVDPRLPVAGWGSRGGGRGRWRRWLPTGPEGRLSRPQRDRQ